jgi:membrane associated rhomboid family serine protease
VLPLIDEFSPRRFPILTVLLILVCVAIFGYQQRLPSNGAAGSAQAFECTWGVIPTEVVHGPDPALALDNPANVGAPLTCRGLNQQHNRFLTLVTSIFLHGSWWHLVGNMLMLWVFGANVEDRLGRIRFLPFVLGCGALAGLAQAFSQPSSTAVVIGASGAIAALIGAYLVLYPRAGIWTLMFFVIPMKVPAWIWAAIFVLVQLVDITGTSSGGSTGVATVAHLAGLAIGAATIRVAAWRRPPHEMVPRTFRLLAAR